MRANLINRDIRKSVHDMNTIDVNSGGSGSQPGIKKQGVNYERPWRAAIGTGGRGKSTKLGEKAYSLAGADSKVGGHGYDSDNNDDYYINKPNTDG